MTRRRAIAIVTGSRAEFGLLRPVMHAVGEHADLDRFVLVAGAHLLAPQRTIDEVAAAFDIAATIPMQQDGATGRAADAIALGRGVSGFAEYLASHGADVLLVLGDRIEAFAAAAAASVAGVRVAHMHGGDRAEGIADEALRHAIAKLAHIHLPATPRSAQRLIDMGEDPARIHIVGSPAIDGLDDIPPLNDAEFRALGRPEIVFLLHPTARPAAQEKQDAARLLGLCIDAGRTVALHPNHDPGREGIIQAIEAAGCPAEDHLPRPRFIGLARRARIIVGNSSAGLIECAALGLRCVNIGPRQAGRDMPPNVLDVPAWDWPRIELALQSALAQPITNVMHPYGDGAAGRKTAALLAALDFDRCPLTKRNTY